MNFFRKKNQIIVSFSPVELTEPVHKLKKSLLGLAPFPEGGLVRLNATDMDDIPLRSLSVLAAFCLPVHEAGAKVELRVKEPVLGALEGMGVVSCFDQVEAG